MHVAQLPTKPATFTLLAAQLKISTTFRISSAGRPPTNLWLLHELAPIWYGKVLREKTAPPAENTVRKNLRICH